MSASRAFRKAIEQRREQRHRISPFRVTSSSACDFCFASPVWYYEAPSILMTDGFDCVLERDVQLHGESFDLNGRTYKSAYRFDRGWLACGGCKDYIEDRNLNGLLLRWARSPQYALLSGTYLERAARSIVPVWELLFVHIGAPVRIYE